MALRITLATGEQHVVDFNHESTLAVTNLGQAEPGAPLTERLQAWTDIVQVETLAESAPNTDGDTAGGSPATLSTVESLLEKTRDELNAIAEQIGIADPHKLPNKQAVADAIEVAPDAAAADVAAPEAPVDSTDEPAPAVDAPADDSPAA